MRRVLLLSMLALASAQLAHPSDGVGAATQTILDQKTRAFVSKAGDCIRRANKVWRTTAMQIRSRPLEYQLAVQLALARCTLDFGILRKRDQRGDWRTFESAARVGIAAVQGWSEGLIALQRAVVHPSRAQLAIAERDTRKAVALWRSFVTRVNKVRSAAGLPPFAYAP